MTYYNVVFYFIKDNIFEPISLRGIVKLGFFFSPNEYRRSLIYNNYGFSYGRMQKYPPSQS